jgi:hypothetical protein
MRTFEGTGGGAGGYVAAVTFDAGVDALIHDFWIEIWVEIGRATARGSRYFRFGPAAGQDQGGDGEYSDPLHKAPIHASGETSAG